MISQGKRRLIAALKSRRTRGRNGAFLVEGIRSAEEALDAGIEIRFAVTTEALGGSERGGRLLGRLHHGRKEMIVVEEQELADLADTEAPQGVILVCDEPVSELSDLDMGTAKGGAPVRHLILDGVQDPGNAGTLIRAALAFDVDAVIALDETVDLWNPKVVRAAAGSSFRVPVVRSRWSGYHEWLRESELPLLLAEAAGEDVRTLELPSPSRWALVVGNEGRGARAEVAQHAWKRVAVPMPGGAESLNAGVAGAILLYDLTGRTRSA